jgi:1-acyl-sn-glycerol-3-phosphate acyltransferase
VVKVDRNNSGQRSRSVRQLKSVLKKGISIFIFPEGTFNKTHEPLKEFYDGAFRIAIETQTPIQPILFLDTYDRMHYDSVLNLNPGRSRSVFLEKVNVDGYTSSDVALLRGKVFELMEKKLIEYRADWIQKQ